MIPHSCAAVPSDKADRVDFTQCVAQRSGNTLLRRAHLNCVGSPWRMIAATLAEHVKPQSSVSSHKKSCAGLCDPQPTNSAPVIADHRGLNLGLRDSGFEKRRDELSFEAARKQHRYRATPRAVGDQPKGVTKRFGMGGHPGLSPPQPAMRRRNQAGSPTSTGRRAT